MGAPINGYWLGVVAWGVAWGGSLSQFAGAVRRGRSQATVEVFNRPAKRPSAL